MATPIPANDAELRASAAADMTGGRLLAGSTGRVARGVTTDSRAVRPGSAFVALRGASHDGHEFVGAALAAGAVLFVVEKGRAPTGEDRADFVEVADTLEAWGAIAHAHLTGWRAARADARVVAVTGSAGKTTTKELCAAILRSVGVCHATKGNLNNRIGVPAVALQVEPLTRFAVFELGMSLPGEMALLAAMVEPDVSVVTNVGWAHAGGVGGTIDDVAREKGALFAALPAGGVAIANADDEAVVGQLGRALRARAVTFGTGARADYRLVSRQPAGAAGSVVFVERPSAPLEAFDVPIPGAAAAIDFVAALAAAESAVGAPIEREFVAAGLRGLSAIPGRMHLRRLGDNVRVLDDTYNASPAAMRAALATLGEVGSGRRVAVLGEMKELGVAGPREHDRMGAAVAEAGVSLLVSCGGLADNIAREAERRGVAVVMARDAEEAARITVERVLPGDVVLVKASRSVGAERVVDALVRARAEEADVAEGAEGKEEPG